MCKVLSQPTTLLDKGKPLHLISFAKIFEKNAPGRWRAPTGFMEKPLSPGEGWIALTGLPAGVAVHFLLIDLPKLVCSTAV
jgi:hypothetical protein